MRRDEGIVMGYVAGRFDVRVILPIAGLVLLAMLTVGAVLLWTAAQQNEIALRNETQLLDTGLAARLKADAEMIYDYAFWDEAYDKAHLQPDPDWAVDNIGRWAYERLGVSATFIVAPDGRTWFAMREGQLESLEARSWLDDEAWVVVEQVRRQLPDRPQARFATIGRRLAVITASPIGKHTESLRFAADTTSLIVQVTFLDDEDLAQLAGTYLLPGLRVLRTPEPGAPRHDLSAENGRSLATLTWRSLRPGDDLREGVMPVLGLAAAAAALLSWFVLRGARDAAAAIAFSEARATEDVVTRLPNRRSFEDRLAGAFAHSRRSGCQLALLYMDLDGFKQVNDHRGHAAGDELLAEVARRLRGCMRQTDVVARLGGDEFAILQIDGDQPGGAERVADLVARACARSFVIEGTAIEVGISVGIAIAPDDASDPRTLVRRADAALYDAKRAGKNTCRRYRATSLETYSTEVGTTAPEPSQTIPA